MTRILKRGQKTYFKEDVVACLADETMQKTFTQSEYGNRIVFMDELQEEAKERFNMDFTDEDYKSFKTLIAKDEYLLSLDDNAGILESKAYSSRLWKSKRRSFRFVGKGTSGIRSEGTAIRQPFKEASNEIRCKGGMFMATRWNKGEQCVVTFAGGILS